MAGREWTMVKRRLADGEQLLVEHRQDRTRNAAVLFLVTAKPDHTKAFAEKHMLDLDNEHGAVLSS